MLKLSLMYKVWNGLALRHLKVRLTSGETQNSEYMGSVLNSGSVECAVQSFSIFLHFLYLSFAPPNCKINTTTLK